MDVFGLNENNSNYSIPRFLCLREIKRIFRVLEILMISIFLTWTAAQLPFAFKISGEYFRRLVNVIVSPLFIFLLGNGIAFTLFFKSRHISARHYNEMEAVHVDLVDIIGPYDFTGEIESPPAPRPKKIIYEDKNTIVEVAKVVKVHRRSQSENFSKTDKNDLEEDNTKKLRRSETEKQRRVTVENSEVVDEMNNEEFQKAIEEFIARQIKFHKEEKLAIVVPVAT